MTTKQQAAAADLGRLVSQVMGDKAAVADMKLDPNVAAVVAQGLGKTIADFGSAKIDEDLNVKNMTYAEAAALLTRRANELEAMVPIGETIVCEPMDGAIALSLALQDMFGYVEIDGASLSVEVGPNKVIQVPWGRVKIPGIDGSFYPCTMHPSDDNLPTITLHGEVKKKHREVIAAVAQKTRDILKRGSIYKSKAIHVSFNSKDAQKEGAPPTRRPKFLDTSRVNPKELVFSKNVQEQVETNLLEPIQGTAECRRHGIPLKRTVLLSGEFGVGKSLLLNALSVEAPANDWTYILIDSVDHLEEAIKFARQFEPAVLVAEDIDQVVRGERSTDMNRLLELIDGVTAKGRELIVVFTTNHPELINPAMMRAGRIDAYIEITPPDAEAAQRLIRQYARGKLKAGEDLEQVGEALSGHKPSVIREVVERAKLTAQRRCREAKISTMTFIAEDISVAFRTMQPHLALMAEKVMVEASPLESHLFGMMQQAVNGAMRYDRPQVESKKMPGANGHSGHGEVPALPVPSTTA